MQSKKAWVVTVDMGYGHQRAAFPFKEIANERIITANSDRLLSKKEAKSWKRYRLLYESLSKLTSLPVIGRTLFNLYDSFQKFDIYPVRDQSKATFPVKYCDRLIKKRKLNEGMFKKIKENNLPLITTFFFTALAAEYAGVHNIYCIATDTDINRVWVAKNPLKSRITYFAPTETAAKRLKLYGVKEEKIIFTGFPLPKENIGGKNMNILKKDLGNRLPNLNPNKKLPQFYDKLNKKILGKHYKKKSNHPLTLTFSVGGAGAQIEIGYAILKSLKQTILDKKIRINLAVGTRTTTVEFFNAKISALGLEKELGSGINIVFAWGMSEYFQKFNQTLRETDILWTKPSELSFYTALGIPIIISPPIGSHEFRNQKWLIDQGCAVNQEDPAYTQEWLFDMIHSGKFADAAMRGFVEVPKMGTYDIEKIVLNKK